MFARARRTMLCARASVPEGPELEEDFDAPAVAGFALDDALCTGASATLDAQTPIVCSLTLEGYLDGSSGLFPNNDYLFTHLTASASYTTSTRSSRFEAKVRVRTHTRITGAVQRNVCSLFIARESIGNREQSKYPSLARVHQLGTYH